MIDSSNTMMILLMREEMLVTNEPLRFISLADGFPPEIQKRRGS